MKRCPCGSGRWIATAGGDGMCVDCRREHARTVKAYAVAVKRVRDFRDRQARAVCDELDRSPDTDGREA